MFILFSDEPKINKYQGDPVYRRLTQGYNVTFNCVVNSGYPEPKLTWWFDWSGQEKEVEVIHYPRYTHQTPSSWTITNILPEDKGKYRCIATNVAGEDDLRFEITQVDSKLVNMLNFLFMCPQLTPKDKHLGQSQI